MKNDQNTNDIPPEEARPQTEAAQVKKEVMFHGIPASPGIAIGTVLVVCETKAEEINEEVKTVPPEEIEKEIARFQEAVDKTRAEIKELQKRVQSALEEREATIFDAHLLIVDDKMLMKEVCENITRTGNTAESVFTQTIQRYITAISAMQDQYLKERADDVKDVASRIVSNLRGLKRPLLDHLPGPRIIIAKDLTPSDTVLLDRENAQAFAIESGSRTSHTAILARSLRIPAVVGMRRFVERLKTGDKVIIDGFLGIVIIHPKEETINLYELKISRQDKLYADLIKESTLRPETLDGYCIQLAANIERAEDISEAKKYGASGVGLFRTEYLYINVKTLPTEEEQFEIYKKVAESMPEHGVVIRTLDVGGDKLAQVFGNTHEANPFLGLRAVRLCLDKPEIIRTQMKAILRAGVFGQVRMMFPMINCMEELDSLYTILKEVKADLQRNNMKFDGSMQVGIMIEIPSSAILAEKLAKKVDFFSIGTNDLVQYTLAVDRANEKVAHLYRPTHPAVLELIARTIQAAKENNIWVSVCGEMAADPRLLPILVGLGVHELSMSPMSIGQIRRLIRKIKMHEAEHVADNALKAVYSNKPLELAEEMLYRVAPEVMNLSVKGI